MKSLILSGTHRRHIYFHEEVIKHSDDVLIICMQRESEIPKPFNYNDEHEKNLFKKHFKNRNMLEFKNFIKEGFNGLVANEKIKFVSSNSLNNIKVANMVKNFNADIGIVFGTDMIRNPLLKNLPYNTINLHLGLSPWYKGSATLFWPFYLLQPQYAGITFHTLHHQPDAGDIIHQSVPQMEYGDTIHDIGIKCVKKARADISKIISYLKSEKDLPKVRQNISGRVWRSIDFRASHLRVIYDLYDDRIVDKYLDGKLLNSMPKLITLFS